MKKRHFYGIFSLFLCQPFLLFSKLIIMPASADRIARILLGIIHLVRTQNFPENQHFLPLDTHTYVCLSEGKNVSFSEDFTKWMIPSKTTLAANTWSIIKCFTQGFRNLSIFTNYFGLPYHLVIDDFLYFWMKNSLNNILLVPDFSLFLLHQKTSLKFTS